MKFIEKTRVDDNVTLRKAPSGIWYITHPDRNGKSVTYSMRTRGSKSDVKQFVREHKLPDIIAARKLGVQRGVIDRLTYGQSVTLREAFPQWIKWLRDGIGRSERTIGQYSERVSKWAESRWDAYPTYIVEEDIQEFVNDMSQPTKVATRQCNLYALRSFFKFLTAKGYSGTDPTQLVQVKMKGLSHKQKETKKILLFTPDEYETLLKHIEIRIHDSLIRLEKHPYRREQADTYEMMLKKKIRWLRFWYAASVFAYETALRLSDICQLEWACFEKPGYVIVWTDKRDKRVEIPLSPAMEKTLDLMTITDMVYCFPEQREVINSPTRNRLSVYFKRILKQVSLQTHSFHGLRHTCLTRWRAEGLTLEKVAERAGHSSTKTTERYIHSEEEGTS